MHKMMDLEERICNELCEYDTKRGWTDDDAKSLKDLSKTLLNIATYMAMNNYSDGYSNDYRPMYSNGYGNSYARNRDSMGRYSREAGYSNDGQGKDAMAMELREAMDKATSEKEREAIQSCMKELGL